MIRFEEIVEKVRHNHPGADEELLRRAYLFSAREHRGQTRKSGEPYLLHPLEVANILADLRLGPECVIAGLLHDVVEDTQTPIKSIEEMFGAEIAHMVEGLTKIAKLDHTSYEERQALNMRKMLLAVAEDVRVMLVKLADRLHNMRTLQYLAPEKRCLIARETLDVYAPVAHMLGLRRVSDEMEELAFKFLDPGNYHELKRLVENRRPRWDAFLEKIAREIREVMGRAHIRVASVEQQIKQLYPLYQNLRRQQLNIDQVHDLLAVRVITESVKDCYSALGVIHSTWRPIPNTLQDMIALPLENLYQAIHTSVVCDGGQLLEVQICTEEMDRVADEGIIESRKQEPGREGVRREDEAFARLKEIIEWQDEVKNPHEFLDSLKLNLAPKKIHCLTPKGEVIGLPQGATPIDFAFAIHTQLGLHCAEAKVNGRGVSLKYQMGDGDILEIITASTAHPSRDWMNFIKTPRARSALRHYFTQRERASAVILGQRLLEREALGLQLNTGLFGNGALEQVAPKYGFARAENLLAAVGYGKILPRSIIRRMLPPAQASQIKDSSRTDSLQRPGQTLNLQPLIRAKGLDELTVYSARCCSPIRGEEIIGYVKRGRGITVHAARCPNAPALLVNPDRIVEVKWIKPDGEAPLIYHVNLWLTVEDRPHIIVDVTRAIASVDTNLRDLHTATNEQGHVKLFITAEIIDFQHLERLANVLRAVEGVLDLERTK